MEKYVKFFVLLAVVYVVSAAPVEEQKVVENVDEPLVDLLSVESSPITDSTSNELSRDKRHHRHYGGFGYGYPYGWEIFNS